MTLRARLYLTFAGITLLVLAPALFAVNRLSEVRNIAFEQRGRHAVALQALGQLQASISETDRYIRSYVATLDAAQLPGLRAALASADREVGRLRSAGYREMAEPLQRRLVSLREATERIAQLVESERAAEATAYFEEVKPLLARTQEALVPMAEAIDERSLSDVAQAQRISESAATGTLAVAAMAFLLALVIAAWAIRSLIGPINRLRRGMADVAAGQFRVPKHLPYDREDEVGDLARAFRTMAEQLAELERLKAEFVSVASHELKTPINVVGGYAELMAEGVYGPVSEKQREVLERLKEQTGELARQVSQLLDVSRIEAGGFRVEPQTVELQQIVDSLRRTFEPLAEQKHIVFEARLDESAPAVAVLDPDRIRNELLGNLLSNAFKFTPEGGRIDVAVRGTNGTLEVEVADSGSGIPADELEHIFDKYYQVGSEARVKGSGLGLAIAREVVLAHGGEIRAESVLEQGTIFHIELPVDGGVEPAREPR